MICILTNGMWIAMPLARDPQPAIEDAPSRLVHITMVHEHHKPFVALPETVDPFGLGIAVGSSPEPDPSDSSSSVSSSSIGTSVVIVGPSRSSVSYQEVRALPLNSEGRHTSFGSLRHDRVSSTSCYVCWPHRNRPDGCRHGVLCDRCHFEHPELPPRLRMRSGRGARRNLPEA